ncbi:MAG: SIS domain-containing protein [Mangrovibacterium sp.]
MNIINGAKTNLHQLIKEITAAESHIDDNFKKAVETIYHAEGRLIITGVGKTGHIGTKLSSTFASTGTPSYFMHSTEAIHGDLGMVNSNDVVMAISNSGTSKELVSILPAIHKIGAQIITLTGNIKSPLAESADIVVSTHVNAELCPLNLAPTSSSTVCLIMGDLLALEVMKLRQFKVENFALYHPGGAIGRRLLQRISDVMRTNIPIIQIHDDFNELLKSISSSGLGAVCVMENNKMTGIITDGDVRRAVNMQKEKVFSTPIDKIMTKNFTSVQQTELAFDVLKQMENKKITVIPIMNDENVVGMVSLHDLHDFG